MTARECTNGRRRYRSREEAAQPAAEFEASGLTLVVGAGRRLEVGRGFDAATLEQLLSALERR